MFPVNAVSGIADSGFVVGMSRGRAWIVVLGLLLGGIVALNVIGLSLSSSGGTVSAKIDEIQQENSVLRGRIASRLSNERITRAATSLGLAVPAPDAVHYDDLRDADVDILTFGQYLRPTANHLPVERFVTPDEFAAYREEGLQKGFLEVVAGPMVRSSYRAEQVLQKNNVGLAAAR